jgi:hypothetical protein
VVPGAGADAASARAPGYLGLLQSQRKTRFVVSEIARTKTLVSQLTIEGTEAGCFPGP